MTVIFCHPEIVSGSHANSQTPFNKFLAKTNKADNLRGPFHVIQDNFPREIDFICLEILEAGL